MYKRQLSFCIRNPDRECEKAPEMEPAAIPERKSAADSDAERTAAPDTEHILPEPVVLERKVVAMRCQNGKHMKSGWKTF